MKSAVLHLLVLITISDLKHWDMIPIVNIFLHNYLVISRKSHYHCKSLSRLLKVEQETETCKFENCGSQNPQ